MSFVRKSLHNHRFLIEKEGPFVERSLSKRVSPHKVGLCSKIKNSFIGKSIHEEGVLNEKDVFHKKIPPKECLLVKKHLFD
jgi:hypothetical protein